MVRLTLAFLLLRLACASCAQAAPWHASLLRNGGFEAGDFADWTLSGNTEYSQVFNQPYDGLAPRGGSDFALLGPQGSDGILSQSFQDTPGEAMTVSFWLASNGGSTDDFSASVDGTALMRVTDTGAFGWTLYRESFTGSGHDTLSFAFRDDQDYLALDRIRVLPAPSLGAEDARLTIPEPATWAVMGAGLLAALAFRRGRTGRHRRRSDGEG
jgi:hypothetical protein